MALGFTASAGFLPTPCASKLTSSIKMAPDSRVDDAESINLEGEALVRQFTDSLNSDTQLEESTMAAQNAEDLAVQGSHEMRMRSLYEDRSRDPS